MSIQEPTFEVGFPGFAREVAEKHRVLFEVLSTLHRLQEEILRIPMSGEIGIIQSILQTIRNSVGAVILLACNGYGADAMKVARGLFEAEVDVSFMVNEPGAIERYVEFNAIDSKKLLDEAGPEELAQMQPGLEDEMRENYRAALSTFTTQKGKVAVSWTPLSFRERAQRVGADGLYRTFYRWCCWLHHTTPTGLAFHGDGLTGEIAIPPADMWVQQSLEGAAYSLLRALKTYVAYAELPYVEALEAVEASLGAAVRVTSR
jgi:hypothetical protein